MLKKNKLRQGLLAAFLILWGSALFAQNQANNWAFGYGGGVSFDVDSPFDATAITTSMNQGEGVATMSDAAGNLLFYTNGTRIWNGSHVAVVTSGMFGHGSATQSAIIVPDPSNINEFYVFTVDKFANANGLQYVKYSTVTEGLVGVSTPLQTTVSEKITAVKKGDDSGYWVLAHDWNNNNFFVYDVSCAGLTLNSIQSVGAFHGNHINNTLGYMKFNADGDKIAIANTYGNYAGGGAPNPAASFGFVQVLNFDNITGVISTTGIVDIGLNAAGTGDDGMTLFTPYGLEFSRNSDFLYIGEVSRGASPAAGSNIYQYEFSSGAITTIGNANGETYDIGALQLGRDGKIYVAIDQSPFLGVINDPEIALGAGSIDFTLPANQQQLTPGTQVVLGLPNFVQSIFSDGEILVIGNDCDMTFSYTGGGEVVAYEWDLGDGTMSTDETVTHSYDVSGTYTVTLVVTTADGCMAEYTLSVDANAGDCCPITDGTIDVIYHSVDGEVISGNTFWTGTHYVEDGVVITVESGAMLDITNVDVVFGECAGIDFQGNSIARINNSVLRPCDMDKTWRGLYFTPSSEGNKSTVTINESTFKNAQTGIYFNGTLETKAVPFDMTLTNNLFLNNQIAIYLSYTNFDQHITGNTFTVEDVTLFNEVACPGLTASVNRYGIYNSNVASTGKIAQNDFISATSSNLLDFYGVELVNSSAFISDNNFSNNYNAVSVRFGSNVEIENNEIGITANHNVHQEQIIVQDCDMVNIIGNQLGNTNSIDPTVVTGSQSAIKVINQSNNVWIRENEIKGFETGIYLDQSNDVVIAENDIQNSWFYGVYLSSAVGLGNNVLVSCNTINMFNTADSDVTGIGFFQADNLDHNVKIYSNCIFETSQAIHLENTNAIMNNMPKIRNNFMYNYTRAGVENINMIGNIGSSGVVHDLSGRNSFISNNWPNQDGTTTGDIISNVPITQNGNYGVGLFTATVTGNANAASFHSTSSCGGQNRWGNNFSNEIDEVEICDNVGVEMLAMFETIDGERSLKSTIYAEINDLNKAILILRYLNGVNPEVVEETYTRIVLESTLFESDLSKLGYAYFMLVGQYEAALELASDEVSSQDMALIDLILMDVEWNDLSGDEQEVILNTNQLALAPTHIYNAKTLSSDELELNIYPSPSKGDITIELNTISENPIVKIYDVNGKLLEVQNPTSRNTQLKLDVSHLANGLYFVAVENDGLIIQGKFVKN